MITLNRTELGRALIQNLSQDHIQRLLVACVARDILDSEELDRCVLEHARRYHRDVGTNPCVSLVKERRREFPDPAYDYLVGVRIETKYPL